MTICVHSETRTSGASVTISASPWTRRLSWRERLRYIWIAIRGRETIR